MLNIITICMKLYSLSKESRQLLEQDKQNDALTIELKEKYKEVVLN